MKSNEEHYAIRTMQADELEQVVDWAAAESWNPGLNDAACFYPTDPKGFLAGILDGQLASSISAVRYGNKFGCIGLYIVRPELRGRGYGLRLWQVARQRMEALPTVGLDGVVEQQVNYAKSGFVPAHRNVRYGGQMAVDRMPEGLAVISPADFDRITAFDARFFPGPRTRFLHCWLRPEHRTGLLASAADGSVVGYGVVRSCRTGYRVGPLFADTPDMAEHLFLGLAAQATAETGGAATLYLDPPQPNTAATQLAERYGLKPVFETVRMYRGPHPALPLDQIYGITTLELG